MLAAPLQPCRLVRLSHLVAPLQVNQARRGDLPALPGPEVVIGDTMGAGRVLHSLQRPPLSPAAATGW